MEKKEFDLTEQNLDEIVAGFNVAETNQVPGMNCPECSRFIPTTIQHIVTAATLVCPHCHLRINIDRLKSGKAIEALRKVQEAQDYIERKYK